MLPESEQSPSPQVSKRRRPNSLATGDCCTPDPPRQSPQDPCEPIRGDWEPWGALRRRDHELSARLVAGQRRRQLHSAVQPALHRGEHHPSPPINLRRLFSPFARPRRPSAADPLLHRRSAPPRAMASPSLASLSPGKPPSGSRMLRGVLPTQKKRRFDPRMADFGPLRRGAAAGKASPATFRRHPAPLCPGPPDLGSTHQIRSGIH